MRLIESNTQCLREFEDDQRPLYCVLSHRWGDGEVFFEHMKDDAERRRRPGYHKLSMACTFAESKGHQYIWIDTCCIDNSSSAELSEAINSMYRWYQEASECLVYLADVPNVPFEESIWFTRGWTLQELIAPSMVFIYDFAWEFLGSKESRVEELSHFTKIPPEVLVGEKDVQTIPIALRMSWAAKRTTTRTEDRAYSLMGLFGVNMAMLYGEGTAAFRRLQEEIIKSSTDTTILLWEEDRNLAEKTRCIDFLAPSPSAFERVASNYKDLTITERANVLDSPDFVVTNAGLLIELRLIPWVIDIYLALIDCEDSRAPLVQPCMFLKRSPGEKSYTRVRYGGTGLINIVGRFRYKDHVHYFSEACGDYRSDVQDEAFQRAQPSYTRGSNSEMLHTLEIRRCLVLRQRTSKNMWPLCNSHSLILRMDKSPAWELGKAVEVYYPLPENIIALEPVFRRYHDGMIEYEIKSTPSTGFVLGLIDMGNQPVVYFGLTSDFAPVCLTSSSPEVRLKCNDLKREACYLADLMGRADVNVYQGFNYWQSGPRGTSLNMTRKTRQRGIQTIELAFGQ